MNEPPKKKLESGVLGITTACMAFIFLGSLIAGEVAWKVNTTNRLTNLQTKLDALNNMAAGKFQLIEDMERRIVGKSPEGWIKNDMRLWTARTELINENWKPAPVD